MTDAVSSATSSSSSLASSTTSSAASNSALGLDFTQYLKILTTQLQNQDPTNATDPNQYTQELVQMEGVQQQINTETDLQNLTTSLSTNNLSSGVAYIGNYVQSTSSGSNQLSLQNGNAEFGYTLDSAAASTIITVQNSSGATVATLSGGTSSGTNFVTWNGADASGETLADGSYTYTISATDSTGAAVTVQDPVTIAQVTGIQSAPDGSLELIAGGLVVSSSDIDAVYTSASRPSSTAAVVQG